MLPHGRVHSRAEQQGFVQVPGTDDTSLQKKPRDSALRSVLFHHPFAHFPTQKHFSSPGITRQPKHPSVQLDEPVSKATGLLLTHAAFQQSSSLTGKKDEGGYKKNRFHPTPNQGQANSPIAG